MSAKKTRKKPGPAPLPPDQKQSGLVMVRMVRDEKARLEAEAEAKGVSMANVLLEAWRKVRK
ncbi:MAG: hypothetical protein AB1696_19355 [Planctomycetota bacterium]